MAYGFNDDRSKVKVYPADDIDDMMQDMTNDLAIETNNRIAGDNALGTRIDTILTGYDDDPNKDGELVDIRTGFDGTVYPVAGDAVRGQINDLNNVIGYVLGNAENLLNFNMGLLPSTTQGVTCELEPDQRIHVYGTGTQNGIRNVFKDINLEPGTYVYGTATLSSNVSLQARKIVDGSDVGYVDGLNSGTRTMGTFTITEPTTVRIRINFPATTVNDYLEPMLIKKSTRPGFYIKPIQAIGRTPGMELDYLAQLPTETDLNSVAEPGLYNLATGTFANAPDPAKTIYGMLIVARLNNIRYQMLIDFSPVDFDSRRMYMRRSSNDGATWEAWGVADKQNSMAFLGTFANNSDFNSATTGGIWTIATDGTYENGPTFNMRVGGTLVVYGREVEHAQQTYQVVFAYFDHAIYMRRRTGDPGSYVWGKWYELGSNIPLATIIEDAEPFNSATTAVTGTKIKVMTYNVAEWDNDTTTDIDAAQLARVKQMLMFEDCDFMGFQECAGVIDTNGENVKSTNAYLFYPNYPYTAQLSVALISKTRLTDITNGTFTSGRRWMHAYTVIDGKTISIYNTHPYPRSDAESAAIRWRDWEEFADIINADENDYIVCFGDFNTRPDSAEIAKFENTFSGWVKANGGYLGWFETTGRYTPNYPNDNILVSPKISITAMRPLVEWYNLLYSDHVPVVANLTLRD